jgi:hypothetical protein
MKEGKFNAKGEIYLFYAQGWYYLLTGLWPLLHIRSFLAVTGPKADMWLVKIVGLLAASSGFCFLVGAGKKKLPDVLFILALTNAAAFASIDLYYVGTSTIRPVYLLDAAAESCFILLCIIFLLKRARQKAS